MSSSATQGGHNKRARVFAVSLHSLAAHRHISATVGPTDIKYGTLTTFLALPSLKISNFQKSKMAAGRRSEKKSKNCQFD